MAKEKVLVEYSDALRQTVEGVLGRQVTVEHSGSRQRGRSTFTDRRGSYGGDTYSGPFSFSFNEKGELVISAGFLNRNGDVIEVTEQIITDLKNGYVCLESHLEDKGGKNEWSKPTIVFLEKPKATAYPLGVCKIDDKSGDIDIQGFRVPMAFILATRQCPLAGGK
jgi:hypothetical protein